MKRKMGKPAFLFLGAVHHPSPDITHLLNLSLFLQFCCIVYGRSARDGQNRTDVGIAQFSFSLQEVKNLLLVVLLLHGLVQHKPANPHGFFPRRPIQQLQQQNNNPNSDNNQNRLGHLSLYQKTALLAIFCPPVGDRTKGSLSYVNRFFPLYSFILRSSPYSNAGSVNPLLLINFVTPFLRAFTTSGLGTGCFQSLISSFCLPFSASGLPGPPMCFAP